MAWLIPSVQVAAPVVADGVRWLLGYPCFRSKQ